MRHVCHARSLRLIANVAAIALTAVPALAQGRGGVPFSTQPVLADGEWNNRTSVAVDRAGNVHMCWAKQHHTDSSTAEVWYGRRAGDSDEWTFTQITNNSVREEFPHLVLDRCDNVHIAVHTGAETSNKIRYVNNVGQGPNQFNGIIDITGPGFKIVKHAVDSTGRVHFVFTSQTTNSTDEVYYTTWTPGVGLGGLFNLSVSPGSEADPWIAIDSQDHVHIAWADGLISGPLMYMNNRSGALQFVSTGVAGSTQAPVILIGPNDEVNIIYRVGDSLWATDDDGVHGFSTPVPLYTPNTYRPAFYNKFAIDSFGRRYAVFGHNIASLNPVGTYIVVETETGFAPPQPVYSGTSNQACSVDINREGKLVVTWSISGSAGGVVYADIFAATAQIPGLQNPCPADFNASGAVDVDDLIGIVLEWGECPELCPGDCPADVSPNYSVDVDDLIGVILGWGPCPE